MLKKLCTLYLKTTGWTFKIDLPDELRSFILLGAPHTSNHDFIPAMALAQLLKRNAKFVIKSDWMKFPMNLMMKPAGAVGIDREKLKAVGNASTTDLMARLFKDYKDLVLMISPEGTRSPNSHWKTGFFYIAQKANVPIVLGYADFSKKILGVGPVIYPRDFQKDIHTIMEFYKEIKGRIPENFLLDHHYLQK